MSSQFDFSTLITDRKDSDVSSLVYLLKRPMSQWTDAEKEQFNSALSKGAYNYTDLTRVTEAMEFLNSLMLKMGYSSGYVPVAVSDGDTPYKWDEDTSLTLSQLKQYLKNVLSIYSVFFADPMLPESMEKLTTTGANQIESALLQISRILNIIPTTYIPCGEALCGGDNL